jgi:hypothetical protein
MKQVQKVVALMVLLCVSLFVQGQQSAETANVTVPPLIQFSNVATDEGGNTLSGVVNITFSLYNGQLGGEPLWTETQNNIQLDSTGHYSVQLGITKPNGMDIFIHHGRGALARSSRRRAAGTGAGPVDQRALRTEGWGCGNYRGAAAFGLCAGDARDGFGGLDANRFRRFSISG